MKKQIQEFSFNFNPENFINSAKENGAISINPLTGEATARRYQITMREIRFADMTGYDVVVFVKHHWATFTKTGWQMKCVHKGKDTYRLSMVYQTDYIPHAVNTGMNVSAKSFYDTRYEKTIALPKTFDVGLTATQGYMAQLKFTQELEINEQRQG